MEEILAYVKAVPAIVPVSKSAAAIVPVEVDGNGFNRACFLISVGAFGTGAGMTCRVNEAATSGGSQSAHSPSTSLTTVTSTSTGKVLAIDIGINSTKPYMKLYGTCGTAAILHSAVCLLYNGNLQDPNLDSVYPQYKRIIS